MVYRNTMRLTEYYVYPCHIPKTITHIQAVYTCASSLFSAAVYKVYTGRQSFH